MGKVKGSKEGIRESNRHAKRVGPLITVDELKAHYLFGIVIDDDQGNELSPETYQKYIDNAISMLEHTLDIYITPETIVEDKDYRINDYADWGYLYLNNFPVASLDKIEMVYFRDANGNPETIQEIPANWMRLQNHDGIVRLVPNARFPANLQVDQSGNYFPEVLRSNMVPHLWRLTYTAGFEDGKVPDIINHTIGLLAAVQALIVGGNLVLGAGIASQSISLDGLSQSIQTTASAENSTYSATIKEYQTLLFGKNAQDRSGLIAVLKDYYKGEGIGII
jgi:hypothetical protein